ncbi:MAG TPA: C40 family peptidase [Ktedonobacteraceae bacterium]|nr:C40 family peptidase [Ktedonobacteraceae bacterium]
MTTITTNTYAVSAGVADIRRYPDAESELVTQALLNTLAQAGEIDGEWTHIALSDYEGWIRTSELEEPVSKGFCKIGETCSTPLALSAVVTSPYASLYAHMQGDDSLHMAYLSTALPLLDTTHPERVQVALPGEQSAWLECSKVDIRQQENVYPQTSTRTITTYARAFLNRPYLWGGTSWEGIDCSGFVQLCYRMGGYIIPRNADQQHDFLSNGVKREDIQEGDLIFFGSEVITHVAMALNNQEYIHAEGQNYNHVVINSFDPTTEHYYPRLDEIVWAIKRVVI